MKRRNRVDTVLALLERAGWLASPAWIVPCRDERGRRAQLRVGVSTDGVTITPSQPGHHTLTPTEAGQLRAVLRDAVVTRAPLVPSEPPEPRRPGTPPAQALSASSHGGHGARTRLCLPTPSEGSEYRHGNQDSPRRPDVNPDNGFRRAA
ncbi:hypothetical protein GCM10025762_18330 [Haloechinothrix salitolerans]